MNCVYGYSHTAALTQSFDRGLSEKVLRESWGAVEAIGAEEAMEWARDGLKLGLESESGIADAARVDDIIKVSGPAYSDMHAFLEASGGKAVHLQLVGVMKRLTRPGGSTEWVSVEVTDEEWLQYCGARDSESDSFSPSERSATHSTVVDVQDVHVSVYTPDAPSASPSLRRETSLTSWVRERLVTDMHVDAAKAALCEQLLLEHDITTMKVLGSMTVDDMTEIVDEAVPKLSRGMKKHVMHLHEEAREQFSPQSTPTASNDDVASASKVDALEAELAVQKRKLDALNKKTAGLKPVPSGGGGRGSGGLVQIDASAEAHAAGGSAAVAEEVLRNPTFIETQARVQYLESLLSEHHQEAISKFAKNKGQLYGKQPPKEP